MLLGKWVSQGVESGTVIAATTMLANIGTLLLVGVVTVKLAQLIKIPDVALFLLTGILVGPGGLKLVNLSGGSVANQLILVFGSILILFDGGMSLDLPVLKGVWKTITLLATLGIMVTAAITGLAVHVFLGLPVSSALLLAAVIASTDPATLVPIFQQIKIKDRVAQTVLSESAFNDAVGAILTLTMVEVVTSGSFSLVKSFTDFLVMTVVGLGVGAAVGYGVAYLIGNHKFGIFGPYAPVMVVICILAAYLVAEKIGGSGYMAVFVAGIILGNLTSFKLDQVDQYATAQHHFLSNLALIMRMLIFILLGGQVNFAVIGQYWLAGLGVVAVFMLLARPAAVLASTLPDRTARWEKNELLFMFWTRETGVIPAALSGILLGMQVPDADVIAAVTFLAILATLLIQASTTKAVARKLDLLVGEK